MPPQDQNNNQPLQPQQPLQPPAGPPNSVPQSPADPPIPPQANPYSQPQPAAPAQQPQPQQPLQPPQPANFDPAKVYGTGPNTQSFRAATSNNNARALLMVLSGILGLALGWFVTILAAGFGGALAYRGGLEGKSFGNKPLFIFGMIIGTCNLLLVIMYFVARAMGRS